MKRNHRHDKPVLLNLPNDIVEQIDACTDVLEVTRTQFLRQSVQRNIAYFQKNELPILRRMKHFSRSLDPVDEPLQFFSNAC